VIRLLQRLNVVAIVKNKGKFLMLRRSIFNKLYQFHWQFPEGGVKFGESVEKALARELKEETGLKLKSARLLGLKSSKETHFGQDLWHLIRIYCACKTEGKIKLSRAHDKYEWLSPKEIKKLKMPKSLNYNDFKAFL